MARPSGRVVVRHSELRDFRQCPLKHRLRWVDGWQPDGESPKQLLGTAWHAVLQRRYENIREQQWHPAGGYAEWRQRVERGNVQAKAMQQAVDEATWDEYTQWRAVLIDDKFGMATLEWMIEGYIELYGLDLDWEVLHVEEEMQVRLRDLLGRPHPRFWYQWHCDLAVRDHSMGGKVIVVDHKSTAQLLGQTDVDLDDQFGLYAWAFSQLGYEVLAPVCNQARTDRLKREMTVEERYKRINSYRSAVEQTNIALDALATVQAIYSRNNRDMPYSSPDPRRCGFMCDFKETHLQIRKSPHYLGAARAALVARGFTQEGAR